MFKRIASWFSHAAPDAPATSAPATVELAPRAAPVPWTYVSHEYLGVDRDCNVYAVTYARGAGETMVHWHRLYAGRSTKPEHVLIPYFLAHPPAG